jgi:hypothetical protein
VTVDPRQREPDEEPAAGSAASTDQEARRTAVVRRLLDRGLRPATLQALLPDWGERIARVAAARDVERGASAALAVPRTSVEEPV